MGSIATASTTTDTGVTVPRPAPPSPAANGWHLAGIIAAPSLGALILNGIGFFNMLAALETSSLGDTGAHWILAGGLELGIVGFALAAFCLSLLNRPSKAAQVFTWVLSLVSATIGYTHVTSTGDEIAVRAFVAAAPILAAAAWHWTLKGVKSVLIDDDLEQKAEAAMMRAAIAARMDHARLDELATTSTGPAKWIAERRLAYAASRSYATQKAVALGVAPQRQKAVSETYVNGAVSVAAVLAEVRPIDVSVPALTQALAKSLETVSTDVSSSVSRPLETVSETVSSPVHVDGGDTVDGVSKAVSPSLETASSVVSETVHETVSETVSQGLEIVSPAASEDVSRDAVDGVADGVSTPVETVSDAVSTGVSKTLETPRETVSKPSVSRSPKKSRGQSRGQIDAATDAEIIARDAAGQKPPEIADALGLGRSTVYKRIKAIKETHTPAYGIPVVQVDEHPA